MAGKTGTARASLNGGGYKGHRGSFVGYFPAERPAYTIAVVVQRPTQAGYYGGVVAAPVFRAVADHLYGTRPELAGDRGGALAAAPRLPVSMNGHLGTLQSLYSEFGIPFLLDTAGWADRNLTHVAVKTEDRHVLLTARRTEEDAVPDVRGMSLRDALQLLEIRGLRVDIEGRGTVRRQSIAPGTEPRDGQTILLELS